MRLKAVIDSHPTSRSRAAQTEAGGLTDSRSLRAVWKRLRAPGWQRAERWKLAKVTRDLHGAICCASPRPPGSARGAQRCGVGAAGRCDAPLEGAEGRDAEVRADVVLRPPAPGAARGRVRALSFMPASPSWGGRQKGAGKRGWLQACLGSAPRPGRASCSRDAAPLPALSRARIGAEQNNSCLPGAVGAGRRGAHIRRAAEPRPTELLQ